MRLVSWSGSFSSHDAVQLIELAKEEGVDLGETLAEDLKIFEEYGDELHFATEYGDGPG